MRNTRQRRDYFLGRLHLIIRGYNTPQYGVLTWRAHRHEPFTVDVWARRTLLTFRWVRHG